MLPKISGEIFDFQAQLTGCPVNTLEPLYGKVSPSIVIALGYPDE
jgi:hypothetical protein